MILIKFTSLLYIFCLWSVSLSNYFLFLIIKIRLRNIICLIRDILCGKLFSFQLILIFITQFPFFSHLLFKFYFIRILLFAFIFLNIFLYLPLFFFIITINSISWLKLWLIILEILLFLNLKIVHIIVLMRNILWLIELWKIILFIIKLIDIYNLFFLFLILLIILHHSKVILILRKLWIMLNILFILICY